jgi:hypothetical protein
MRIMVHTINICWHGTERLCVHDAAYDLSEEVHIDWSASRGLFFLLCFVFRTRHVST